MGELRFSQLLICRLITAVGGTTILFYICLCLSIAIIADPWARSQNESFIFKRKKMCKIQNITIDQRVRDIIGSGSVYVRRIIMLCECPENHNIRFHRIQSMDIWRIILDGGSCPNIVLLSIDNGLGGFETRPTLRIIMTFFEWTSQTGQ